MTVHPRLRVLVMSTGTELVAPGTPLQPGQIYESNAVMLAAAVRDAGGEVVAAPMCGDDVAEFRAALDRHRGQADLIITTGGVSAGAYEVVKDALGGEVEFVKVAMQPGMPQGAGRIDAGTPIITLPGNPVSALVSFEVFLRAPLRAAMGLPTVHRPIRPATLTEPLNSPAGKRQFRRGVLEDDHVISYGPPASHHLRWLASAPLLPTRFDHKFHRGVNCVTCHHNFLGPRLGPQPCLACHKAWGTTEWRRIDTVFHTFCTDCHRTRQAAGLKAGPVKACAACHVAPGAGRLAVRHIDRKSVV